jgi:predicted MPP superfamily phosphohydrolase
MFLPYSKPIIFNLPKDLKYADIYFIHDVHYGSELFDERKWKSLKKQILDDDHAYVCWIGDLMENAIPNSKSDMFTQRHSPAEQKEWAIQQLFDLKDKTIAIVPGNHEYNRTTKSCGLYPIYDCCLIAGISDKYRNDIAFVDIAIGTLTACNVKQVHYFGQIQHKAKDIKSVCSADYTDGIDFFASGHDHEPKDKPRAKLVFDAHNKKIHKRNVECLNSGSFCEYGGYGATNAYRPQSDKMYKLRIFSGYKHMESTGFYL